MVFLLKTSRNTPFINFKKHSFEIIFQNTTVKSHLEDVYLLVKKLQFENVIHWCCVLVFEVKSGFLRCGITICDFHFI